MATQRAVGLTLVGLGAVLIALFGVGRVSANAGYVWPDRLLNHPIIYGMTAGALVVIGAVLLLGGLLRGLVIILCVGVTAAWLVYFSLLGIFSPSPVTDLDVSNQAGTLKARVFSLGLEETDLIRIEQTNRGPLNRSFVAGCISFDSVGLEELRWEGSSLIADTEGGSIAITVDNDGHAGAWHKVDDATIDESGEEQISLDVC
jgi:hypothetical protein